MLDELRLAATRQRSLRTARSLKLACKRLLSQSGEPGNLTVARQLIERLQDLDDEPLDGLFEHLAHDLNLNPDPQAVLRCARACAEQPSDAQRLIALNQAAEPPRQERLRRLNRMPGGTEAVLRSRRAWLKRLPTRPDFLGLEADLLHLLHLLGSWFNPGFLQMRRVDWNSSAPLLERIIQHEAGHAVDGWDDRRRRLQPDRCCFAYFHPQRGEVPLIFAKVALLAEMQSASPHKSLREEGDKALRSLCAACLLDLSPLPEGDAVARFHLDNGARLERLNLRGNMAPGGLRQSLGVMVNCLYDLDRIEASPTRFRHGEVARARAVAGL